MESNRWNKLGSSGTVLGLRQGGTIRFQAEKRRWALHSKLEKTVLRFGQRKDIPKKQKKREASSARCQKKKPQQLYKAVERGKSFVKLLRYFQKPDVLVPSRPQKGLRRGGVKRSQTVSGITRSDERGERMSGPRAPAAKDIRGGDRGVKVA